MRPKPQDGTYTAEDLFFISSRNGEQYELIEGTLMVMEPPGLPHGYVASNLTYFLAAYVRERDLGRVLTCDPGFLTRGDNRTVRAPDVAYLSYRRFPRGPLPEGFGSTPPDLVAEVVSPRDRPGELGQKTREWLAFGAKVVWVVDPREQTVRVETRDSVALLRPGHTLTGGRVLTGFSVRVADLFAR